jgi:hypothetical protein
MTLTLLPAKEERVSWQADLFSRSASVHEAVAAQGVKGVLEAAEYVRYNEENVSSLPRALAGRMGRQIADNAGAAIIREYEGGALRGFHIANWHRARTG